MIDLIRRIFTGPPSIPPDDVASAVLRVSRQLLAEGRDVDLAQLVCEALVEELPALELVWVWMGDRDPEIIRPLAFAGRASAYAAKLEIRPTWLTRYGPVWRTVRGQIVDAYQITPTSVHRPWRELAQVYGIRSVNVVPLAREHPGGYGLLALYASDAEFFSTRNQSLFVQLGQLLGSVMWQARRTEALAWDAFHDPLTGVLNRRGLHAALDRLSTEHGWYLMLVDVDHFKQLNTELGYVVADRLLVGVANTLVTASGADAVIARVGGDEFAVLVRSEDSARVTRLAQTVLASLPAIPERQCAVTCSIGVVALRVGQAFELELARADAALRRAKAAGRGRSAIEDEATAAH